MTDAKPPGPPAPAPAAASSSPQTAELNADRGERWGTTLMIIALGALAVVLIDVAAKGKLLAPLFAWLPAPKPSVTEGPGDAETRPAGE